VFKPPPNKRRLFIAMIKMEEKYLVSAEDISRTAINVAFRVGLERYDKMEIRKILRDYALIMYEIAGENMIPWTELKDWKACAHMLEEESTLEKVYRAVMKAKVGIENSQIKKENLFTMPEE
jgi:hypothetical protein